MANEEEMEDFSISEHDLDHAMGFGGRHFKRSKNSAIYGVFGGESDEEEASFSYSSKKSKKSDYTAPVGFVKGGVQGKPDSKEEDGER